jgi:hypothetical protein
MKAGMLILLVMLASSFACSAQSVRKVDEYGKIQPADAKARLDNYAIALQEDPASYGYIIGYAGRRAVEGEAQSRLDFAKDYLVLGRGIDPARITTMDGGFREEATTEVWVVPSGAMSPSASPTVDPSEVVLKKKVVKKKVGGGH